MSVKSSEIVIPSTEKANFRTMESFVLRIIHNEARPVLFGISTKRAEDLSLNIANGEIPEGYQSYEEFIEQTYNSSINSYKESQSKKSPR